MKTIIIILVVLVLLGATGCGLILGLAKLGDWFQLPNNKQPPEWNQSDGD